MTVDINISISGNPDRRVIRNVLAHFQKDIHAFLGYMGGDEFEYTEHVFGKYCTIKIKINE